MESWSRGTRTGSIREDEFETKERLRKQNASYKYQVTSISKQMRQCHALVRLIRSAVTSSAFRGLPEVSLGSPNAT